MITARIEGDLRQIIEQKIQVLARAATDAVAEAGQRLKDELRAQVTRAGLGTRLANTWRMNLYPSGGQASLGAAAFVFCKAPLIISAFNDGVVITGKEGLWLAIPTAACPKRVMGQRVTPHLLERAWTPHCSVNRKIRWSRNETGSQSGLRSRSA